MIKRRTGPTLVWMVTLLATCVLALVPVGGGIGKILAMGKQPTNASTQFFYNVVKPDTSRLSASGVALAGRMRPAWIGRRLSRNPAVADPE